MSTRTYLDWNASAPLRPEARAAICDALAVSGNPSSVHAEGRAAKAVIEKSRSTIAEALGCRSQDIVFTSGATEAASLLARWPGPVVVDPTAHDALWAHNAPERNGAPIRAIGLANSETGIVSKVTRPESGSLLIDATQAIGRVPFAFNWSGADFAVISAHKFGGPKGIGALVVKDGADIPALSLGGGQEMGRRAGTENVAAIAGFAAALSAAMSELEMGIWAGVAERRDAMEAKLQALVPDAVIVGSDAERLPNTSCVVVPGWKGETQVMQMDLAGFAISAGSACSSGKVKPSRVLKEMGFDDVDAASAIRVSFGPATTEAELSNFVSAWAAAYERHRARAA